MVEDDEGEGDETDDHQRALEDIGPDDGGESALGDVEHDDTESDRCADIVVPAEECVECAAGCEDLRAGVDRDEDDE